MKQILLNIALFMLTDWCKVNGIDCSGTCCVKDGRGYTYSLRNSVTWQTVAQITFHKSSVPTYRRATMTQRSMDELAQIEGEAEAKYPRRRCEVCDRRHGGDECPITTADEARDAAIDWQHRTADKSMSLDELTEQQSKFEALAEKFGLTEEFKENGII